MGNFTRNAGVVLGQSTGKRIGIAVVSCALTLGTLLMLTPTARAQEQMDQPNVVLVSIQDFFFNPSQITIRPGTTVMWTNAADGPHEPNRIITPRGEGNHRGDGIFLGTPR